jgi:hypothetical protein
MKGENGVIPPPPQKKKKKKKQIMTIVYNNKIKAERKHKLVLILLYPAPHILCNHLAHILCNHTPHNILCNPQTSIAVAENQKTCFVTCVGLL